MPTVNFPDMPSLLSAARSDKSQRGADRYPLRWILFDTFEQAREFIDTIDATPCHTGDWLAAGYPDTLLTYSELALHITRYVQMLPEGADCVITAFSELARFYATDHFYALLRILKGIEAAHAATRVYIPIVGMAGKMERLVPDSQLTLWQLHTAESHPDTRVVLCRDTYGVPHLEERYTVVHTLADWLAGAEQGSVSIICTSQCLYAARAAACPDNAFSFVDCDTAHSFITRGLGLDFSALGQGTDDLWRALARIVEPTTDFCFTHFAASRFNILTLGTPLDFVRLWFEHPDALHRWILTGWYTAEHDDNLTRALQADDDPNVFVRIALYRTSGAAHTAERSQLLNYAADHGANVPDSTADTIATQLRALAEQDGHAYAAAYLTRLTHAERTLAIEWIGAGQITPQAVAESMPDLAAYLAPTPDCAPQWAARYIDTYKQAKLHGGASADLEALLAECNANEITMRQWQNDLCTTRTLLQGRNDYEAIYWIDGLGLDWLPFMAWGLKRHGMRLCEAQVARALLPTTTACGRDDLLHLSADIASNKFGDLDSLAHRTGMTSTDKMIAELDTVAQAIERIATAAGGQRVAIVSDHGLTYLAQHYDGLALAGVEPHHHGRYGVAAGDLTADDRYVLLSDGHVCALTHRSLGIKTPQGLGAHGGATPEEVLVPVMIVEPDTADTWQATLLSTDIDTATPMVRWRITGLTPAATPTATYNNRTYRATHASGDEWVCGPLSLQAGKNTIALHADGRTEHYNITFRLAAVEDDPFDL